MIFAIALASNLNPEQYFHLAYQKLIVMGETQFSSIFKIPCRDHIGDDYWNSACLLSGEYSFNDMEQQLKTLEQQAGRVRPSHRISLDLDIIAWGDDLNHLQLNDKKLPLALDVQIPLSELWLGMPRPKEYFDYPKIEFRVVE